MYKKFLFLSSLLTLFCGLSAFGSDHPEAHFGIFGIQKYSTLTEYQQAYTGKTVMYVPANTPSYNDNEYFAGKGGKFNTPYVLSKITGDDNRMTFTLVDEKTNEKVKMIVNNGHEYYSYGKYCYCVTNQYSVPLVVIDDIKRFVETHTCNFEQYDGYSLKLTDISFKVADEKKETYPVPYYVYTNTITGKTYEFEWGKYRSPDTEAALLGKVYSHPKVKAKYQLVDIISENDNDNSSDYRYRTIFVGKDTNSGDIVKTSNISLNSYGPDFFREAVSGNYVSVLTAVEKPSDSSVRYGKTTTIEDEDKGVTRYSYVDDIIDIIIFGSADGFGFELKNVGQNSIKIIWNEAAFVGFDGNTSKIMHVGTKYSEREGDQPATTIIKGAKIIDSVTPTANVYYDEGYMIGNERHGTVGWKKKSIYPKNIVDNPGQLRLMLPIQVKDVVNEYTFVFDVKYVYKHPELLNL